MEDKIKIADAIIIGQEKMNFQTVEKIFFYIEIYQKDKRFVILSLGMTNKAVQIHSL